MTACRQERKLDKIFVDEAVGELHTIQDMIRWTVSRLNAANVYYGHGTDNPWDEAVQLVLPSVFLPLDIPEDMHSARLTSSERHRIVERVIRRVNERVPVAYLTNKAWFCGMEFYVDERVLVPRSPIAELINNRFSGILHDNHSTFSICVPVAAVLLSPVLMPTRKLKSTRWISPLTPWRLLNKTSKRMALNIGLRQSAPIFSVNCHRYSTT